MRDAAIGEAGNTSAAAAIVRVGEHPGRSIDFLCQALGISHSAIVRLIDSLVAEELVIRQRNSERNDRDRRGVALYLKLSGEKRLRRIHDARFGRLSPMLETLSESECNRFLSTIEKLIGEKANDRPSPQICRLCDYGPCESTGCPVRPYLQESGDR